MAANTALMMLRRAHRPWWQCGHKGHKVTSRRGALQRLARRPLGPVKKKRMRPGKFAKKAALSEAKKVALHDEDDVANVKCKAYFEDLKLDEHEAERAVETLPLRRQDLKHFKHFVDSHARRGSSDADGGPDDSSVGSSTKYGKLKHMPVSFANWRIVACQGCGAKANELSEASNASEQDEWNGYHPWNSYVAHPTELGCKAARRALCLICWMTFVVLGLHMQHVQQVSRHHFQA